MDDGLFRLSTLDPGLDPALVLFISPTFWYWLVVGRLLGCDPITPDCRRFIGDFADGVFGFRAYLDASSCAVDALEVCFDETREPWRDRLLLFCSCICVLWGAFSRVGGRWDLSWLGSVRGACSSTTCGVGMFD